MGIGDLTVLFMSGAIAMGCFVAGVFFLRYWRQSRDRLFFRFAFAFALLGFERLALLVFAPVNEVAPYVYLFRLLAFLVIVFAIVAKNRQADGDGGGSITSRG
jgi:hypothetical protein